LRVCDRRGQPEAGATALAPGKRTAIGIAPRSTRLWRSWPFRSLAPRRPRFDRRPFYLRGAGWRCGGASRSDWHAGRLSASWEVWRPSIWPWRRRSSHSAPCFCKVHMASPALAADDGRARRSSGVAPGSESVVSWAFRVAGANLLDRAPVAGPRLSGRGLARLTHPAVALPLYVRDDLAGGTRRQLTSRSPLRAAAGIISNTAASLATGPAVLVSRRPALSHRGHRPRWSGAGCCCLTCFLADGPNNTGPCRPC